jgi:hypothetical protein
MAWSKTPWSAKNGLGFGLVAGVVFVLAECMVSLFAGQGMLEPLRYAASVLLGSRALMDTPLVLTAIAGLGVHLILSAFFGLAYSLVDARMALELRPQAAHQTAMGMLFAVGVWVVTFQFISRGYYPWFLSVPQFFQMVLHAVFYGLPLGLMFAAAERRRVALAEFEQRAFEERTPR